MEYKLNIPDKINRSDARLLVDLIDGQIIDENFSGWAGMGAIDFDDIPSDWLEPIQDGPVSAYESAVIKGYNVNKDQNGHGSYVDGFEDGEQNDRKRTQPVIDAAVNLVSLYEQNENPGPSWEKLVKALKQLEQ